MTFSSFCDHSNFGLLKIQDIITFQIVKFVFEFLNNKAPLTLNDIFTKKSTIHNYPTSAMFKLYIPKINTIKYGINSIKCNGLINWNLLLKIYLSIKEIETVSSLQNLLYNNILEFYSSQAAYFFYLLFMIFSFIFVP